MNIADQYLMRQVLTERYIATLSKKYLKQLKEMDDMVARMITEAKTSVRLEALKRDIEFAIGQALVKFDNDMLEDIERLAEQELDFVTKTINANSKVLLVAPKFKDIKRAIMDSALNVGLGNSRLTLGQALNEFAEGQAKAIRQVIFDGIVTGQTNREMAAGVRALAEDRTPAQVQALTRTLSNHTTSQTRRAFAEEYRDVFDAEEWVSTLDSRTTLLCSGRDGTIYPIGTGPYPPAHWNCRSLRIPVIKESYDAQTSKSKRPDFDTWLRNQNDEFQKEFFGDKESAKAKLALFKKGDLTLDKFRDESGREYSLEELKMLYSSEAKQAGIINGQ